MLEQQVKKEIGQRVVNQACWYVWVWNYGSTLAILGASGFDYRVMVKFYLCGRQESRQGRAVRQVDVIRLTFSPGTGEAYVRRADCV